MAPKMTPMMAHKAIHGTPYVAHTPAPNPTAPVGQGGRFQALKQKLASKPGITNPGALAASIGRKKYGGAKFQAMAKAGKHTA